MNNRILVSLACLIALNPAIRSQSFIVKSLEIRSVGKAYTPHPSVLLEYQDEFDGGGTTSIRNNDSLSLKWKNQGYFQRNRDLGQIFIPKQDILLDAIVLRTGPSSKAVLEGIAGEKVFIQFFHVIGSPVINDNGTPPGTSSTHGFSDNHRTDDFIEGIEYLPLDTVYEGSFPWNVPATYVGGEEVSSYGKLHYMRWSFPEAPLFREGVIYAFVVGISEPGPERGFSLANLNLAISSAAPSLENNPYTGGWGMRREGNGTIPPTHWPSETAPKDPDTLHVLFTESLFQKFDERLRQAPSSDGYPDVDTYRGIEFYMEGRIDATGVSFGNEGTVRALPDLYPNPFTSTLTLRSKPGIQGVAEILSMDGRVAAICPLTTFPATLQLQHLPEGIYLLRMKTGVGIYLERIIKR